MNLRKALGDTILDGELVIDVDPRTRSVRVPLYYSLGQLFIVFRQETLRLLLFDCLVHDEINIMSKSLTSRYGVGFLSLSFLFLFGRGEGGVSFCTGSDLSRYTENERLVFQTL